MYNALPDLLVFGLLLSGLGVAIWWFERKPKLGATPATRQQIIIHQRVRRIENGL